MKQIEKGRLQGSIVESSPKEKIVKVIYDQFAKLTYLEILELSNLLQAAIIRSFRENEKMFKAEQTKQLKNE